MIAASCGSGKSHFVANRLLSVFPDVSPLDILFVTSRAMTVDQQTTQYESVDKYDYKSLKVVRYWNREDDSDEQIAEKGIQLMTYDKLIYTLINRNHEGLETLGRIKIVVLDECHILFSDLFIKNIELLKVWIRDVINAKSKTIIGMTATPGILHFYKRTWGVPIKQINKVPLINYKAKRLICTDFKTIPYIINSNKITGRTLIMCQSVQDCFSLQKHLSNAAVMVSKNSSKYTPEMDDIRQYIVEHESLPDTFTYRIDKETCVTRELCVLICTSTAREGFNLREESGVRNVISCFSDELHITQFAGRCRYSLDSIVVVNQHASMDNYDKDGYLARQRESFKNFMQKQDSLAWFKTVFNLVSVPFKDVEILVLPVDGVRFTNYINSKWLVPIGETDTDKYKIWRKEDQDEILNKARDLALDTRKNTRMTLIRVVRIMKDMLGYDVISGIKQVNKERKTYKLVIGFDMDASVCREELIKQEQQGRG